MKVEIKVPAMGESITEAVIGNILIPSGSAVKVDDEILELETDKVNQVLYASENGVLTLNVKVDDEVVIGDVLGFIDTNGTSAEAPAAAPAEETPAAPTPAPVEEATPAPAPAPAPAETTGGARQGKDAFLADLQKPAEPPPAPVAAPAAAPVPAPAPAVAPAPAATAAPAGERETRQKMTKIRKVIAQRLVEAQQTTAMLTTFNDVDMSAVMALRSKHKDAFEKEHGTRLGFMSFFVKAVVSALGTYKDLNAYIDGDDVVYRNYFDIGIAVGSERGLVVPVLRNCDHLSFDGIESGIRGYAEKARSGRLAIEDLQGGGFTITNGGVYGSLLSTPILNPPQSGILGMHKIEDRPVVKDGEIVIRPMMYLALSYDHRIVDGKGAVSFLVHVKECLEDPSRLLLGV